jgi:hypothetical protein
MSVKIECEDYYHEVLAFAKSHDCEPALNNGLSRLRHMCAEDEDVFVFKDFAPNSFAFLITDGDKNRLIGGLIYSGPGQRLDGSAPTFTVSVDAHTDEHKWGVHT